MSDATMNHAIARVRRLTRRCTRIENKLESLAARSADARRVLNLLSLQRDSEERLRHETSYLGYCAAWPSSSDPAGSK